MAKIDLSKIEGYEAMSAEDKLKALESYEFEAPANTQNEERLKSALSKANSEAAEYKRQLREKQTEEEKKAAERAEQEKKDKEELEALRRENKVNKFKANYIAAGYSAELAEESAKAQVDGDTDTVMKNQLAFIEATKKDLETKALGNQPGLSKGSAPNNAPKTSEDKIVELAMKYAGL